MSSLTPEEKIEFKNKINSYKIPESFMAHYLGVSLPTVQRWKSGQAHPYKLMIPAIFKRLDQYETDNSRV